LQIEETDEARKKFSNAKAISSSQFFGTQNREEKEAQLSLQKYAVRLRFTLSPCH